MSPIIAEKKPADESQHENILEILEEEKKNPQKSLGLDGSNETQDVQN